MFSYERDDGKAERTDERSQLAKQANLEADSSPMKNYCMNL
jgi:hypothetical protein